MGYAYTELIAPAILLDNPGIKKEEFADRLEQTHAAISPSLCWNGLNLLAHDLSLDYTNAYLQFETPKFDSNGLELNSPQAVDAENMGCLKESSFKFEVTVHVKNSFRRPRKVKILTYESKLEKGTVYENSDWGVYIEHEQDKKRDIKEYLVDEILTEQEDSIDGIPSFRYFAKVLPIERIYQIDKFDTLQELYESWPQFKPENIYDFSQPRGYFIDTMTQNFFWINKEGRYYLDPLTFDHIPASVLTERLNHKALVDFGYTDLILTAEAVKHEAWEMMQRNLSYSSLENFLTRFPDSRERYAKAVWDAHTFLAAKEQGMNYTQLLRMRLLGARKVG